MCAAAKNCQKAPKVPNVSRSRSFKVIDVDIILKLVTSDKKHCVCLSATVFTLDELIAVK